MAAGSGIIQTGSASATASGQMAVAAVAVSYSSTGASGSNGFTLINNNSSGTPNGKQFDKTTTASGAQSSIITTSGDLASAPSYSAGNIIILREAVVSYDPKRSSAFLSFFL